MSFASEFRKKYFQDPLKLAKRNASREPVPQERDEDHERSDGDGDAAATQASEVALADGETVEVAQAEEPAAIDVSSESEPVRSARDEDHEHSEGDGDAAAAQASEVAVADSETVESAEAEQPKPIDITPESEPAEQSETQDADGEQEPAEQSDLEDTRAEPGTVVDDPEQAYQHEVIASRPDVEPAETRTNFHHVLGAMVIAAALMAVLHSGALATYARGLPYGKVYERIIVAAEVWHGYMEQIGLIAVMTTTRDWVTAMRESRWADIAGLVGLEDAPDLDEAAVPLEDSTDVSSEMQEPDAGIGAIDDVDAEQPEDAVLPEGGVSLPPAGQDERDR